MQEVWRDILGYEGYYQASSLGHVRSSTREITQKGHKSCYTRIMNGKTICPRKQNSNYDLVWLSKDGEVHPQLVHRLVAQTFIINSDNKPCVNHINGNKSDNRVDNLEWCYYSENIKHSHNIAGRKRTAKFIVCVELNRTFQGITDAASKLNINRCSISHALNGKSKSAGGFKWRFV